MTVLRHGVASHTGMVRTVNQDSTLVAEPLYAVADGMGGHAAGEVASQVAVEALQVNAEPTVEGLVHAIRVANRAVFDKAEAEPDMRGMGTTLCAVVLVPAAGDRTDDTVVVANVGDSRVYLFHAGELEQVTEDHSLVEGLVREGRLTAEEAKVHPQRNVITRVLGVDEDVEVDTWEIVPHRGDRFLLCSDGLFNEVDEGAIAGVLRRLDDPDDAAAELVRLANEGGGRDNVTVVLVDVVDDGGRAEAASEAVREGGPADGGKRAQAVAPATLRAGPVGEVADAEDDPPPGAVATATRPVEEVRPTPPVEPPATSGRGTAGAPRPRRLTWRVGLFVLALLVVAGGAAGATAYFARSTYYVGVDGDEVAIFQGRPGGVLWFDPTLSERTGLAFDDVPPSRQDDVAAGKQESSLDGARRYVERLLDQAGAGDGATTTTSTEPPATRSSAPDPGAPAGDPGATTTPSSTP